MMRLWIRGIVRYHPGRLAGAALGIALAVALLVSIGAIISSHTATMTRRAIGDVPVDWQIQLGPGADLRRVTTAAQAIALPTALEEVGYADVSGFSAGDDAKPRTTSAGKVLGIGPGYRSAFPLVIRDLVGTSNGVLIAQQMAASLRVGVGDIVTVRRVGLPPVRVAVEGIVDLPAADSLFQAVGAAAGVRPTAPPDNVLLVPLAQWHQLFDADASGRAGRTQTQLHVRVGRELPASPDEAVWVSRRLTTSAEARFAGGAAIGDNLSARLESTRADALYARVLFLFLGLPGATVALLLALAVTAAGATSRARAQALLRLRGASMAVILRLSLAEALIITVTGVGAGLALATATVRVLGERVSLFDPIVLPWVTGVSLLGLVTAMTLVVGQAWAQARETTVRRALTDVRRNENVIWQRVALDLILLAASAAAFWQAASTGYEIVLAPEGVPQASVSYQTLVAPVCLWLGSSLLALRLGRTGLSRGRRLLTIAFAPIAGTLAGIVSASVTRQRQRVTRGMVLVALATSFGISTAVFNTTYNAQARVDAELTSGADVTVSGLTDAPPGGRLSELAALPGVAGIQPMQHRFAYVGNDLQDLYGIDPKRISEATTIVDAYFKDRTARDLLEALAARPDGILVSWETITDFGLSPGDLLEIRLQHAADQTYRIVPFHVLGVVREFPTAPRDSFLVANASYVAEQTGTSASEIVLLRATGSPSELASRVREAVHDLAGTKVTDVDSAQRLIGSSLTAVDLRQLTQLELVFAALLMLAATGLVMALGSLERRRTYATLVALGATSRQVAMFLWGEGLVVLVGGSAIGLVLGLGVARMLVTLLAGVFDPPPEVLVVPWGYVAMLGAAGLLSTVVAVVGVERASRQRPIEMLRGI